MLKKVKSRLVNIALSIEQNRKILFPSLNDFRHRLKACFMRLYSTFVYLLSTEPCIFAAKTNECLPSHKISLFLFLIAFLAVVGSLL